MPSQRRIRLRKTAPRGRLTRSSARLARSRPDAAQAEEAGTASSTRNTSSLPVIDLTDSLSEEDGVEDYPTVPARQSKESDSELPMELSQNEKNSQQTPEQEKGTCPVCFQKSQDIYNDSGHMVATLCGHVFCCTCLFSALKEKNECPTCRKKTEKAEIIRLFI